VEDSKSDSILVVEMICCEGERCSGLHNASL
jgi:hypothetical protein